MQVIVVQVLCLLGVFVITLACCLLPIKVVRLQEGKPLGGYSQQLISFCNCLAGGVFLSMCFLGLIPNVQTKFKDVFDKINSNIKFPAAESIVVVGFLFVLLLEQLVLKYRHRNEAHSYVALEMNSLTSRESDDNQKASEASSDEMESNQINHLANGPVDHGHSHGQDLIGRESGLRFTMLFLAVAIHSVFEGVALGLQTVYLKVLNIFLAIIIHEALVAFALGISLGKLNLSWLGNIKFAVLFCIMIPIGGGIGLAVGTTPGLAGDIVSGVLQGLAAGTFIYVTFFELIPNEFEVNKNRLLKVLFVFLGFILWACLTFFTLQQR